MSNFFEKYTALKNDFLLNLSEIVMGAPSQLQSSIDYSLLGGGKRLRPVLFLSVFDAYGRAVTSSEYKFACAIECIHIYSLIHDDLPAMDNDDFRRGELTNHKKFGEATALLAGDALLNYAYQLLLEGIKQRADLIDAALLIANNAGTKGMIGGQALEFETNSLDTDAAKLLEIYDKKTAMPIKSAILTAAMIVGCNNSELAHWESFAHNFGLAFQLKDDLIDGESQGDCTTLLNLRGKENTKQLQEDYAQKAFAGLSKISADTFFIKQFASGILNRKTDEI